MTSCVSNPCLLVVSMVKEKVSSTSCSNFTAFKPQESRFCTYIEKTAAEKGKQVTCTETALNMIYLKSRNHCYNASHGSPAKLAITFQSALVVPLLKRKNCMQTPNYISWKIRQWYVPSTEFGQYQMLCMIFTEVQFKQTYADNQTPSDHIMDHAQIEDLKRLADLNS